MSGNNVLQQLLPSRPAVTRIVFALAGGLLPLAFAPFGLWFLAPLLLVPMLLVGLYASPRVAAGLGFCFGAGLFLSGTYWIYISIHEFGRAPLWLAVVLMLGVALIMAAWYALCGWLFATLVAGRPWRLVSVAPAAWVLVEWLRGWVMSGFPWLTLGYSQIDSPLAGWLPVFGVYGVSFLVALTSAALLLLFFPRARWQALCIAALPWVTGAWLQQHDFTWTAGDELTATMVQGGVPQDQKWLPEQFRPTLELYRNALLAAADSDIVIWPEVAIPATNDRVQPYLDVLQQDLQPGQSLLLGILERDFSESGEQIYNSVLLLDGASEQRYRKRHLVPFGEYFPVPDFVREWMRLLSLPNSDLTAGADRQDLLVTAAGQKLAVAICYEDAYGAEQLYALPEASLLVNISNDAWFGDSIAPHQHLQIARVRAAEVGRFVMRTTNNGISALIGPNGAILSTAPQFEFAATTVTVVPMQGLTPYARLGNTPIVSLVLFVVAVCWLRQRKPRS